MAVKNENDFKIFISTDCLKLRKLLKYNPILIERPK